MPLAAPAAGTTASAAAAAASPAVTTCVTRLIPDGTIAGAAAPMRRYLQLKAEHGHSGGGRGPAEGEGFEPPDRGTRSTAFKAAAFDRSATPPEG